MTQLSPDEVWKALLKHYTSDYGNLVHMISVLLLIPGKRVSRILHHTIILAIMHKALRLLKTTALVVLKKFKN